jgi:hypothetical protein
MSMDPALFEQLAECIQRNENADPDATALSGFFKYWWVFYLNTLKQNGGYVYAYTVCCNNR